LVVELTRKNICTIGDLSRLDEASINRLPIANPKISHAKAVLQVSGHSDFIFPSFSSELYTSVCFLSASTQASKVT
jgi:hypothetical protein